MRRSHLVAALLTAVTAHAPLAAQSLSERFSHLFTFGDCGQPLCLEAIAAGTHGLHFIPSVTQGEDNLLSFLTGSIGNSLGNLPFTAASAGYSFSFVGGAPVATSLGGGPIFAERSQTLGRGRFLAGFNINGLTMDNVRGVPLNDLTLRFTHQNTENPALGDPIFERDIIEVTTDLSLSLLVTSVFASYGVLDNVDIGVLVPLVRASLEGTSEARILPYQRPTPHQFAGTPELANASAEGSATGIGDIAVRAKVNLYQAADLGVAAVADVRLPTGDEENFLGSGETSIRALGVISGRFGNFSPHLNAGAAIRSGENQNSSLLATLGFDHLLSERVSLAIDIVSDFELGDSKLVLPQPVVFTAPAPVETVELTDIPDRKDNIVDASFGAKFILAGDYRVVTNVLFPLSEGGLRPKLLWTLGLEKIF